VMSCPFSFLAPGKHIPEHRGPLRAILRFHLMLSTPCDKDGIPACIMNIDGLPYRLGDGESLLWDDTYRHEVWNRSNQVPRGRFVVLKGDMRLVRPRHNTREDSMWKTPDYFAGKTVLVVGAASGTALIFARERAKSDSRAGPISGLGTPLATSPRMREGVKKKSNR